MKSFTDFKFVSEQEVEADLSQAARPTAYENQSGYPFDKLTERQFECLLYDLYKAEIEDGSAGGRFDKIMLMQGVGERGRDCVLLKEERPVGLVQCKKIDALVTKPDAGREMLKFILHAIKDPSLMPRPEQFQYVYAVSGDFNERAKTLLNSFNSLITQEPDLEKWTNEVEQENKSLVGFSYAAVEETLHDILRKIQVTPLNFNDLGTKIEGRTKVIAKFFAVKKVISEESLDPIKEMLGSVVRAIADEDVMAIVKKLRECPANKRFDAGVASFWGYPESMVNEALEDGSLWKLLREITNLKAHLDGRLIEYLKKRVDEAVLAEPGLRGFSPFTRQACVPYLFGRLSVELHQALSGKRMASLGAKGRLAGDVRGIREHLLKTGKAVLQNDFTEFVQQSEQVKAIARLVHACFTSVDAMEQTFDAEWPNIEPVLAQMEHQLRALIPPATTLVAGGLEWFDDDERVKKLFTTLAAREER